MFCNYEWTDLKKTQRFIKNTCTNVWLHSPLILKTMELKKIVKRKGIIYLGTQTSVFRFNESQRSQKYTR